jgi:geranylgeranyl diphosphate synthase type II
VKVIKKSQDLFDQRLTEYLALDRKPYSLYEPMNYTINLGGKRLRPAILISASNFYKDEVLDEAIEAALAVELFHNFTLVHDDIMDAATLRRGNFTAHTKFGVDSAILTGDVMLIKCYELLMHYNDEIALQLIRIFNKMAVELCEGQRLDMDFEKKDEVSITDYIQMITLKTSVLLGASLQMGAVIGGASKMEQAAIYEFGKNIGIAFQIQDDILDVYGDQAEVGKKKAGDIIQNKKTYLYLKALELAVKEEREYLIDIYKFPTKIEEEQQKVSKVTKIFDNLVVREYANQLKDAYKDLAISHLNNSGISENGLQEFTLFSDYLLNRSN